MIINSIKILIIFSFSIFLLRHFSYLFHIIKKNIEDPKYSFYFNQTPALFITFFLIIYLCDKSLIYGVMGISYFYFFLIKSLYYFIPFFPNRFRYQLMNNTGDQLLILFIHYLLTTWICLTGIKNGMF